MKIRGGFLSTKVDCLLFSLQNVVNVDYEIQRMGNDVNWEEGVYCSGDLDNPYFTNIILLIIKKR